MFIAAVAAAVGGTLLSGAVPDLAHALPQDEASPGEALDERRYALPQSDGVSIDEAAGVMLVRAFRTVSALSLACPHQKTALRWNEAGRRFECPKHRSRFEQDGTLIGGRARRSIDRFAVRRDGEAIVVSLNRLYREDRDAAEWRAAVIQL